MLNNTLGKNIAATTQRSNESRNSFPVQKNSDRLQIEELLRMEEQNLGLL